MIILPTASNTLQTSTSESDSSQSSLDLEVPPASGSHHSQLQTEVAVDPESKDLPDEEVDRHDIKQLYARPNRNSYTRSNDLGATIDFQLVVDRRGGRLTLPLTKWVASVASLTTRKSHTES